MKKTLGFPSARKVLQGFAMHLCTLLLLLTIAGTAAAQDQDPNLLNKRVSYRADGRPLLKVLKEVPYPYRCPVYLQFRHYPQTACCYGKCKIHYTGGVAETGTGKYAADISGGHGRYHDLSGPKAQSNG